MSLPPFSALQGGVRSDRPMRPCAIPCPAQAQLDSGTLGPGDSDRFEQLESDAGFKYALAKAERFSPTSLSLSLSLSLSPSPSPSLPLSLSLALSRSLSLSLSLLSLLFLLILSIEKSRSTPVGLGADDQSPPRQPREWLPSMQRRAVSVPIISASGVAAEYASGSLLTAFYGPASRTRPLCFSLFFSPSLPPSLPPSLLPSQGFPPHSL